MNQVSKAETTALEVNYSEIAKKYYNADEATLSEYISDLAEQSVANSNELQLTFFARIVAFFNAWTQHSYDAWEKAGTPDREF